MNPIEYYDKVFNYMEYLGVPELVIYYKEEDVAKTFVNAIGNAWRLNVSPRMTAILIWSLTIEKVRRMSREERIH